MDDTLEILPGEGNVETVTRKHVRIGCDECGEPAHFKHTYLLPNARGNPASSAYRQDDCTWCEDEKTYTCKTCKRPEIDGYGWCSTFPASARFAHMFLKFISYPEWAQQPKRIGHNAIVQQAQAALTAAPVVEEVVEVSQLGHFSARLRDKGFTSDSRLRVKVYREEAE